ncbi:MAG: TlpA disulfide reductase family protein [Ginsengibacter sp.]
MKFKKTVLIVSTLIFGSTAFSQSTPIHFKVSGKIDKISEPAKMILHYRNGINSVKDTISLTDGSFRFSGEIQKPVKATLSVLKESDNPRMMMSMGIDGKLSGRDGIIVYLDKGHITIKGQTLQTAKLKGSKAHKEHLALQRQFQPVYDKLEKIKDRQNVIKDKKSPEYEALALELREGFQDLRPVEETFIRANTKSWVSWNIMADKSMIADPELYRELYGLFGTKFTNTEDGYRLKENIESAYATQIGQPAPLFSQADTEGKLLSLASLKGKYVLIDFWASWCGPCRVENPFVVKAYHQFKDKNFEILGVSLDDKKDAWLKAIKEDELPWLHVSDLKAWKNEVAVQYYIGAVPQNLLLDPNGVIIAKNLRGEALAQKLAEVLK